MAGELSAQGLHLCFQPGLDPGFIDIAVVAVDQLVQQSQLQVRVGLSVGIGLHALPERLPHRAEAVKAAHLAGKGVVGGVLFPLAYFPDGALEHGRLAGQFLGMVRGGEGDMHVHRVAGAGPQELLLEARDEGAAAQHQGLVLGGAALKLHAVAEARIVQHQLVAGLADAPCDGDDFGVLLQKSVHLPVDLRLGDDQALTGTL